MIAQKVRRERFSFWRGLLLFLLTAFCLFAFLVIGQAIMLYTGNGYASLLPWFACALFGYWIMKRFLTAYNYSVANGMVYLERCLGSHRKLLESFSLTAILEFGPVPEIRRKHPEIKSVLDLTLQTCPIEKVAYYFKGRGGYQIAILQPNEEIKAALWDMEKRKLSDAEKWG